MWTKFTYVCNDCDAMTEISTLQDLYEYRGWCACGSANLVRIDVEAVMTHPSVTQFTPVGLVKINTNPYN